MKTESILTAVPPPLKRERLRPWASILPTATLISATLMVTACSSPPRPAGTAPGVVYDANGRTSWSSMSHVPDFATFNFEPFNRQDAVAIALREWRLFGSPVVDDDPESRPDNADPSLKPERMPGLWQRVGEYWWVGQNAGTHQVAWTGKQDGTGRHFSARDDGNYAWSAAFISYIMRIDGANGRFPYAPNHATYINAAISGQSSGLIAQKPSDYAPQLGDLICAGRGRSRNIRYAMLPTARTFPSHCGIVVATEQNGTPFGHQISMIGGNVMDAVALTHVPTDGSGRLASSSGQSYDSRYNWLTVLQVRYDAEQEPDVGM